MLKPRNWWLVGLVAAIAAFVVLISNDARANGVPGEVPPAPAELEQPVWPERIEKQGQLADEDASRYPSAGHDIMGLVVHPYAALTLTRVQGKDDRHPYYRCEDEDHHDGCKHRQVADWSTGFKFGAEFDAGPLFVGVEYRLRDILTDGNEVFPWDGEFDLAIGGYW
jgi:hypothetical protein